MLQDLRIEKEDLQALLAEMEKRGFVATTLHEIRTFTMAQRRTPLALDLALPPAKDDTYKIEWLDSETVRLTPSQ